MHILVITRSPWRDENNIGNTMSNIFGDMTEHEIYGMCFRSGFFNNSVLKKCYNISEMQFISGFKNKFQVGEIVQATENRQLDDVETKVYNNAKRFKWRILWFVREFIWTLMPWKNESLKEYLEQIKPDVVFMPVFDCWYPFKVLSFVHEYTKAKVVLFHADDNYSMKQYSFSPLYWIFRINTRKWIKKCVGLSSLNFAITEAQKNEYEKYFKKSFKVLYKGKEFSEKPVVNSGNSVKKILFTGNISSGRYKSLAFIGEALDKINKNKKVAELDIYTFTPLTKEMKRNLCKYESINLHGGVTLKEVENLQSKADILVHVESFDMKSKLSVRLSFSTKIVDYLYQAKCILAIGPDGVASIDYLIRNDAAFVITDMNHIEESLTRLVSSPQLIEEYSEKAWLCGKRNHDINKNIKMIIEEFEKIINENTSN